MSILLHIVGIQNSLSHQFYNGMCFVILVLGLRLNSFYLRITNWKVEICIKRHFFSVWCQIINMNGLFDQIDTGI